MKILIADKMPESGRARLTEAGLSVTFEPDLTAEALPDAVGDHDVLIVRSTEVSADVFERGKSLQLVVRAGAGYNTIDVAKASDLGVYVANCPGKNAIAVAELTVGLLIGLDRRIPQAHGELREGAWNKKEYSKADGLFGRRYGVIGVGNIGREVIRRVQALGMTVVAWSRSLTDEQAAELGVQRAKDVVDLAGRVDACSVHLARTGDTRGLLSEKFFAKLPERAMVINASRDGIVDEKALLAAMESRGIRYATDVYDDEPGGGTGTIDNPITRHPAAVCTPHIGASTEQAQQAVADEAVRIVTTFASTGDVPHCVNLCVQSPARWQLNVRHVDRVGVLANVLTTIREADVNVEELENIIFDGAKAACAKIRLDSELGAEVIEKINGAEHVIDARMIEL